MKLIKFSAVALAMVFAAATMSAQQPMGEQFQSVGPVVAGSVSIDKLPKHAQHFIKKNFPDIAVTSVEREYLDNEYDVEMADGVELTFNLKGDFKEIDAPDGYVISTHLAKAILPGRAINFMTGKQLIGSIESIQKVSEGYIVDLVSDDDAELQFDKNGQFVALGYD